MCVVSMVGDHFQDKWNQYPYVDLLNKAQLGNITRWEFEELKKEVKEMKDLLVKAKIYDTQHNEPDCEIEDKMKFLKECAKLVGIDLDDILNKQTK
jgi:hypothetical protein